MPAISRKLKLWWRRTGAIFRAGVFLVGALILTSALYLQPPSAVDKLDDLTSPLLFFVLINLIIVVTIVMALLIGRNVVKLIFDRRRRILGSKLRMRLVLAFVGFTLIPIVSLFVVASGLITDAMGGWFGKRISDTVEGAVEVAREHYAALEREVQHFSEVLTEGLEDKPFEQAALKEYLERKVAEYSLTSISIVRQDRGLIAQAGNITTTLESMREPEFSADAVNRAFFGKPITLHEEQGGGEFIRVYSLLHFTDQPVVMVVSQRMAPEVSAALGTVVASFEEYQQLEFNKQPLRSSYILMLTMFTGLVLFSAVWFGFYLARELTDPIQRLAEGTKAVAAGDYDFSIHPVGDDELAFLVRSFNRMTADLKQSRAELERRGKYIETILSNLAIAVVSIDTEQRINLINPAAMALFGLTSVEELEGKGLSQLLPSDALLQVEEMLRQVGSKESDSAPIEKQFSLSSGGRELQIVCTVGLFLGPDSEVLGSVILFDDVTELSKAQAMAAWREVARRIAHEIKNPLTPIQLAAQRLQKLLASSELGSAVTESTETIVLHVDSIKRLANEFSNFARMPTAEPRQNDLNTLIAEVVTEYSKSSDVMIQFISDQNLPPVFVDREQLRRVLINLIDNAIDALLRSDGGRVDSARIVIKTEFDPNQSRYQIEIADNGPGIPASDKARIFEPYYTTKKGGTGLGLTIVNTIISDHQGNIRVYDNAPRGTRVVIQLPLSPVQQTTPRRFGVT